MEQKELLKKLNTYDKDTLVNTLFHQLKYSDEEGQEICFENMDYYSKSKKQKATEERKEKMLEANYDKAAEKKRKAWMYHLDTLTEKSKRQYEIAEAEYELAWEAWLHPDQKPQNSVKIPKVEKVSKPAEAPKVKTNNLSLFEMV